MRIVFMGTPEFAVDTLKACAAHFDVLAVFTQPDRPKGRGKKLAAPPVKQAAEALGIPVYQPERIKAPEWRERLDELAPDAIVVVAYGQLLPECILEIPRLGCINVHASLLPKYRGAAPIQWAVASGEARTGVTTMYMDAGMDTGDMLLKAEVSIEPEGSIAELSRQLASLGAELLIETLEQLHAGSLERTPQNDSEATYAPLLRKDTGCIDWSLCTDAIIARIRGFEAWPGAHTLMGEQRLKIFRARPYELGSGCGVEPPGTVLPSASGTLVIRTGDGALEALEVQYPGSRRMPAEAFLRGHSMDAGTRFEMGKKV